MRDKLGRFINGAIPWSKSHSELMPRGEKHYYFNKKFSEEHRQKLSIAHMGKVSPERRQAKIEHLAVDGFKICYMCEKNLSTSQFHKSPRTEDKLHRRCKQCRKVESKQRKANKKYKGDIAIETIQMVYEDNIKKYGTLTCIYCLKPIEFGKDTLEHKVPLPKGTNLYKDLAVACASCNSRKRRKTEKAFRKILLAGGVGIFVLGLWSGFSLETLFLLPFFLIQGWFNSTFGFSSQDITDPIMNTIQGGLDVIKEPVRKAIPKEIVDVLPILAGVPGRALRETLEDNTSGESIWERTLKAAPKDILTQAAIMAAVVSGGTALGAFGGAGAAGAGGGLNIGGVLSTIGEAFGLPGAGVGAGGATTAGGGLGSLFGLFGGGGGAQPFTGTAGRTAPGTFGAPFQYQGQTMIPGKMGGGFDPYETTLMGGRGFNDILGDLIPNIMGQGVEAPGMQGGGNWLQDILGNLFGGQQGQQGQQGGGIGDILGNLFGGGGTGGGTGGGAAGGIQPYSAPLGVPQVYPELLDEARQRPEFGQYQDIFQQGLGGLDQLANITPEYFNQFNLAGMGEIGPEYFQQFQQPLSEAYTPYLQEQMRIAQQGASLAGNLPSALPRFGTATAPMTLALEQNQMQNAMNQAMQALGQRQQLQNIGEQRAGRGLVGATTAATSRIGFDPNQFAASYAGAADPMERRRSETIRGNEELRTGQKQADRGMWFDLASRGATALGQPGIGDLLRQAAPVFGGTQYPQAQTQQANPLDQFLKLANLKSIGDLFGTTQIA